VPPHPQHHRRTKISIAFLPQRPPAAPKVQYLPTRFRALALFGRRPSERVVSSVLRLCSGREQVQQKEAYSITSSAATSSLSGTVRPSILAVWALMTSSILLDCRTGKSVGLAPLRMRPV